MKLSCHHQAGEETHTSTAEPAAHNQWRCITVSLNSPGLTGNCADGVRDRDWAAVAPRPSASHGCLSCTASQMAHEDVIYGDSYYLRQ